MSREEISEMLRELGIETLSKVVGIATAYGYALSKGYTGTEEEFAELMASYASVAEEAQGYAEDAEAWAQNTRNGTPVPDTDPAYHKSAKYEADRAEASANQAAQTVGGMVQKSNIASTFSDGIPYSAGDYAYYQGNLYRFTADHAAGAWTGADAVAAVIGNDVSGLKSAFENAGLNLVDEKDTYYRVFIPKAATITISRKTAGTLNDTKFRLYLYDSTKTALDNYYLQKTDMSRTINLNLTGDVYYLRYIIYEGSDDKLQVEIGDSASSYKPYSGCMPYFYEDKTTQDVFVKGQFSELKNDGNFFLFPSDFEYGTITGSGDLPSTQRMRTKGFIAANNSDFQFIHDGFFEIIVQYYTDAKVRQMTGIQYFNTSNVVKNVDCAFIRLVLKKHTNPDTDITEEEFSKANIFMRRINPNGAVEHITVMTHNVGHYNYGQGNGGYDGADYDSQLQNWRNMYGMTKPDIIVMQEWYQYFDKYQQRSSLSNLYVPVAQFNRYYAFSSTDGRAIVSKYYLRDMDTFTISGEVSGTTYTRNVLVAVAEINGHDVLIVDVHLSPGRNADAAGAARLLQADDLITKIDTYGYEKVLLCGDFNSTYSTGSGYAVQSALLDKFTAEGYVLLNNGYFGAIETLNDGIHGSESVDNIMVKGFSLSGAASKSEWICTSDHYPLLGYVTIR